MQRTSSVSQQAGDITLTKRHYRVLCPSQRVTSPAILKRRFRRTCLLLDLDLYTNRMAFNRKMNFYWPRTQEQVECHGGRVDSWLCWQMERDGMGVLSGRGPAIGPICPLPRTLCGATAVSVQWIETYERADGAKTAGSLLATGDEVANLLYVCFERVPHKEWGCAP
jgi:hypothetical protein